MIQYDEEEEKSKEKGKVTESEAARASALWRRDYAFHQRHCVSSAFSCLLYIVVFSLPIFSLPLFYCHKFAS
jgi:hypothetical protein